VPETGIRRGEGTFGPGSIDCDRLVADLRDLVRIPSITGSEEAVAAWVRSELLD
jgi:hypothetical protein